MSAEIYPVVYVPHFHGLLDSMVAGPIPESIPISTKVLRRGTHKQVDAVSPVGLIGEFHTYLPLEVPAY